MSDVKEIMRTKSQKFLGMLETALNLPVTLDRQVSSEEGRGNALTRAISTRKASKKEEEEYEAGFNGEVVSMEGMVNYEDLVQLLSCMNCGEMCGPPITQCRKGHLYCITCKATNRTCKVCKQTMVDSPNIALDRLLSFIALPCKFGSRGCPELQFLNQKGQHETLCRFRPVPCQNADRGCEAVFSYKDICWHHKQCPHGSSNLIPAPKTEKPVSAPSTPSKRKPSKTSNSLRAQIKEARDKKSSKNSLIDATEIDIKIDAPEETSHDENIVSDKEITIDVENAENKSDETSKVEEIPILPGRKKVIKK